MSDTIFKYPLDLHGTSPDNKVSGEVHVIGTTSGRIFASDYGPFFGNSAVLKDGITGRELIPMLDYVLVHYYLEASQAAGQAVYAAARITNPDVNTRILCDWQLIGGEFSFSTYAIKQAIEELALDQRPIEFGDLVGVPAQFVPTPHLHDAYDLYGLKYVVEAQADVAAAIREGDAASRALLLEQIQNKFDGLDEFCMALGQLYSDAADELSLL